MIIDAMSSMVPSPLGFAAAEGTLGRLRGYLEHFSGADDEGGRSTPNLTATKSKVDEITTAALDRVPTEADFMAMLDGAGVDMAAVYTEHYETRLGVRTAPNSEVAEFVGRHPDKLFGFGGIDPWDDDAPQQVEQGVRDFGLKGFVMSPFKQGILPHDPRFARVFAKCEELGVAVLLHAGINWWFEADYDIGHPRDIDKVANAFPNLTIVALHCGWPWVLDMMMVTWRHPNVYVDISAHRPRHFTIEAAGWGPLLQYGNRMLSHKVLFASTWTLAGIPLTTLIDEVRDLPLKDDVIEQWLGGNAARAFKLN